MKIPSFIHGAVDADGARPTGTRTVTPGHSLASVEPGLDKLEDDEPLDEWQAQLQEICTYLDEGSCTKFNWYVKQMINKQFARVNSVAQAGFYQRTMKVALDWANDKDGPRVLVWSPSLNRVDFDAVKATYLWAMNHGAKRQNRRLEYILEHAPAHDDYKWQKHVTGANVDEVLRAAGEDLGAWNNGPGAKPTMPQWTAINRPPAPSAPMHLDRPVVEQMPESSKPAPPKVKKQHKKKPAPEPPRVVQSDITHNTVFAAAPDHVMTDADDFAGGDDRTVVGGSVAGDGGVAAELARDNVPAVNNIGASIGRYFNNVDKHSEDIAKLQAQVAGLAREAEARETKIAALERDTQGSKTEIASLKRQVLNLKKKVDDGNQEISRLQVDPHQLRTRVLRLESAVRDRSMGSDDDGDNEKAATEQLRVEQEKKRKAAEAQKAAMAQAEKKRKAQVAKEKRLAREAHKKRIAELNDLMKANQERERQREQELQKQIDDTEQMWQAQMMAEVADEFSEEMDMD